MVRTKEEIMTDFKNYIGEDTSDNVLAFTENLSDTLDSMSSNNDAEHWKRKYEDMRKQYRDRFFNNKPVDEDDYDRDDEPKPLRFEDLFKKG